MSKSDRAGTFVMSGPTNVSPNVIGALTRAIRRENNFLDALRNGDEPEETVDTDSIKSARKWAVSDNKYFPCEKAVEVLPSGSYTAEFSDSRGVYFEQKDIKTDELLILPDSESEEVVQGIERFWTKEEHYRRFNFMWKRGVLLTGPPGSGKTSTVQIIIKKIIALGGLAVYVGNPQIVIRGLEAFRIIEPTRPIVVILEDIDSIIDRYEDAEILALLDGELQIDNVVFIATTNYPELLDKRIKNRPSRFDILKVIGMPSKEAREMFLTLKNPRLKDKPEELDLWVKKTDGFSIAHLKEIIISVECLEIPFEEVLDRLYKMLRDDPTSSNMEKDGPGFLNLG